ncbi:MAG: tetratricopeptide repeat protein [Xanthobacteraceae bacterium]
MRRSTAMLMAGSLAMAACSGHAPPEPAVSSTRSQLAGPWRHLPTPVSDQQFKQDKAYCSMTSEIAPADEGSIEIKRAVTFLDCLRSKGYERVLSSQSQGTATPNPVLPAGTQAIGEPYARAIDAYLKGNYDTAGRLMRPLAKKGKAPAQFILGYANFINLNYPAAVKWYQRAAGQGYAEAQNTLGEMYLGGLGVQESTMQAYVWFSLAAANNDPLCDEETRDDAAHNRDLTAVNMTTEQIAEARRLINEWKPKPEPYARINETEQAKAKTQVARPADAKRKLAESGVARKKRTQADLLGMWLREFRAWLRGLVS